MSRSNKPTLNQPNILLLMSGSIACAKASGLISTWVKQACGTEAGCGQAASKKILDIVHGEAGSFEFQPGLLRALTVLQSPVQTAGLLPLLSIQSLVARRHCQPIRFTHHRACR